MSYKRELLEKFTPEQLQELVHDKHGSFKANALIKGIAFDMLTEPFTLESKMLVVKEACIRALTGKGHVGIKKMSEIKIEYKS